MGLAVLAGGLAFVGTADATELIIDGSFENTTAGGSPIVKLGGTANPVWVADGAVSARISTRRFILCPGLPAPGSNFCDLTLRIRS